MHSKQRATIKPAHERPDIGAAPIRKAPEFVESGRPDSIMRAVKNVVALLIRRLIAIRGARTLPAPAPRDYYC
jgi:hypothetical protein